MKFKFRAPENPTLLLIATTLHPVEGNGAYLQLSSNQGKGENPREGKFGAANRQGTMQSELIINIPRVCYQWEISHFRSMRFTEIGRKSQETGEFRFWNALSQITESEDLTVVGIMQLSCCLSLSPLKPVSYFFHLILLKSSCHILTCKNKNSDN